MALPVSGTISLSQIQTEFTGSNPISISEYYRGGGLVTSNNTSVPTSGAISLSNFYGAVRQFAFTIASSATTTQDLRTLALAAGWDAAAPVVATISSGVTLRGAAGTGGGGGASVVPFGSNNVAGTAGATGLTVSGSFPGGVSLINNGTIYGGGGGGGAGGSTAGGGVGGAGGSAIIVSTALSITNNSVIGGGGGGGGGGSAWGTGGIVRSGGGGGGGAVYGQYGSGGNWEGIDGGPGGSGTETAGGGGGFNDQNKSPGGVGGARGAAGTTPYNTFTGGNGGAGGAGGAAVSGNSYVTWVATGTRYGALA
jgi:hypothetical protein